MKGYIKIKKADLTPDKFGKHISITMIGLYDENDKWIKWIPMNKALIELLKDTKIEVSYETEGENKTGDR